MQEERRRLLDMHLDVCKLNYDVKKLFAEKQIRQHSMGVVSSVMAPSNGPEQQAAAVAHGGHRLGGESSLTSKDGVSVRKVHNSSNYSLNKVAASKGKRPGKTDLQQQQPSSTFVTEANTFTPSQGAQNQEPDRKTSTPIVDANSYLQIADEDVLERANMEEEVQLVDAAQELIEDSEETVQASCGWVLDKTRGLLDEIDGIVKSKLQPKSDHEANLEQMVDSLVESQLLMEAKTAAMSGGQGPGADASSRNLIGKLTDQVDTLSTEIYRVTKELDLQYKQKSKYGCLEQAEELVERDKQLVQVKASLVLQKLTISKELETIKEELKSGGPAPNMRLALDHAKKGHLKSLAGIRYKLDHIHRARQDNMAVLVSIFSRIDNLSRAVFNGSAYQPVLEWNRQVERKHMLLKEPEMDGEGGSVQKQKQMIQKLDASDQEAQFLQAPVGAEWYHYSDRTSAIGHTFNPQLEQMLPNDFNYTAGQRPAVSQSMPNFQSSISQSNQVRSLNRSRGNSRGSLPPLQQAGTTSYGLPGNFSKSKTKRQAPPGFINI